MMEAKWDDEKKKATYPAKVFYRELDPGSKLNNPQMEDNKKALEKIKNEYWYEFEKMEDKTPLTAEAEYVPYGPEWQKEMSQFPKPQLIKMLGAAFSDKKNLSEQTASLQERVAQLEQDNAELKRKFTGTFLNELVVSESWKSVEEANGVSAECIVKLARCQQLNEKLMGLLEKAEAWRWAQFKDGQTLADYWQSFCQENGI